MSFTLGDNNHMIKVLTSIIAVLALLSSPGYAEKIFELQEIRSGNDISNVRKLYPNAKVVYFFFEMRTGIYFSVYEVVKGKRYLFIMSENEVKESSWRMTKNGKPFANANKSWKPHDVKVYYQKTTQGGSEVDKSGTRYQNFGYMLDILPTDTMTFSCDYVDDDKKQLRGTYYPDSGWKITMDRTAK